MTTAPSRHVLRFGSLDWKGQRDQAGWWMHALAEGASFGNSVPVEKTLAHQLLNGSLSEFVGYDVRTATFDVMVEADDSIALNNGAATLDLACDSASRRDKPPVALLFTPPDGLGKQTRYRVLTAKADWLFDDLDERDNRRRFRVTIKCEPFGLSAESTTDAAASVESPAGEETVNACDSLTGFTGLSGTTAALDTSVKYQGTGSVKANVSQYGNVIIDEHRWAVATGTWELTGLSLTTPATRPFITFKGYVGDSQDYTATLHVNSVAATLVSTTLVNSSWALFTFHTDVTATITTLRFSETITGSWYPTWSVVGDVFTPTNVPSSWAPRIDNILRDGSAGSLPRQSLRSIVIGGSAPAEVSLAISHPTNGLGTVLALVTPSLASGFRPDLMRWCTTSTTTDSASISGKVKTWASGAVDFEFPASMVPSGSYQLWGVLETGSADEENNPALLIETSTKVGSTALDTFEERHRIPFTGNGVFEFIDCGPVTLPPTDVPLGSTATVVLSLTALQEITDREGVIADASFREFFLIPNTDYTTLGLFDCGGTGTAAVGTANSRLWLDSASLSTRFPKVEMGTQANRTDAYSAVGGAERWQGLSFPPGEVLLYLANTGGTNATVDATYTRAWQGLAAS